MPSATDAVGRLRAPFGDDDLVVDAGAQAAALEWAASGAMSLTGRRDGPPLLAPGAPASFVRAGIAVLSAARIDGTRVLPGTEVLSERAAIAGLSRNAPASAGGAYRSLRAHDGWIGLSLPRASDVDLIAALVECRPTDVHDGWGVVEAWTSSQTAAAALDRMILLGLPAAIIPATPPSSARPAVIVTPGGRRERSAQSPLVVDFTSLWAGPLCANLLGLAGARVIKVESLDRPDGARNGPPEFFDLLHRGHECVAFDFAGEHDRLIELLERADVVLEASRPRALRQLGLDAERWVTAGKVWASITAYGRDGEGGHRVGFGDDIAAGAGLVAWSTDGPLPVGDAIADPLTGAYAAATVALALRAETGALLDISMHDVAVAAAAPVDEPPAEVERRGDGWYVRSAGSAARVAPPRRRAGWAPPRRRAG